MATLLEEGVTANGSTKSIPIDGECTVYVIGTFDTCTVTFQISPDDGTTWLTESTDSTFTAAGHHTFTAYGAKVRATTSSVGASTDVDIYIGS
jgi:hypothetical protein